MASLTDVFTWLKLRTRITSSNMAKVNVSNRYATVPNSIINHKMLSFKAKGLWAYIQSKPDDWDFSAEGTAKESSDGLDSIKSGLRELEDAGLLDREKYQDEKGHWHIVYTHREKPVVEKATSEKPPTIQRNSNKEVVLVTTVTREVTEDEDKPKKKLKVTPEIQQVFDLFHWNPARLAWRLYESERVAAQILFDTYGIDKLRSRLKLAREQKQTAEMTLSINCPSKFLQKMIDLEEQQHRV